MNERTRAFVTDLALRLNEFSLDERLEILVTLIVAEVSTSPDSVREWGRILSSLLEGNPAQIEVLCANVVAQVWRKHEVGSSLERSVDVAEGLETQVLAALERAARASD